MFKQIRNQKNLVLRTLTFVLPILSVVFMRSAYLAYIHNDIWKMEYLGFLATKEYSLGNLYPGYSPTIDVIWFYTLLISR